MNENNDWWIYVRRDTLQVYRTSPVYEPDDETHIIRIDQELGLHFVHSPHKLKDYVIYYDGEKASIVKKDSVSTVVGSYYVTPVLIKEGVDHRDITIKVRDSEFDFVIRPELRAYGLSVYANLSREKQVIDLYISARNDPNQLLEIVKVNMIDVVNYGHATYPFKHKIGEVSFFTRKIFDHYGLVVETHN